MTRPNVLALALWLAVVVMAARGVLLLRTTPSLSTAGTGVPSTTVMAPEWPAELLLGWSERVMERNLFDADRSPVTWQGANPALEPLAGLESSPELVPVSAPTAPSPSLRGIVGGPVHWEAVLGDVPGRQSGVLVRRGDTVGELHVQDIGPAWVVLQDADSTLRLTLRTVQP